MVRRTIAKVSGRLDKERAVCEMFSQVFCGVLSRIVILCALHIRRLFFILLQRGIAIPDCEAAALPGRFLPELGRSSERPFFSAGLLGSGFVAPSLVDLSPRRSTLLPRSQNPWRKTAPVIEMLVANYSAASGRESGRPSWESGMAVRTRMARVRRARTVSKTAFLAIRSSSRYSARLISICSA